MSARSCVRRFATGVAIASLAGTVVIVTPASATPQATAGVQTRLSWSRCFADVTAETETPYQCAVAQVPLDYDAPSGAAVQLAVVRIPARDQAHKIGSIFLNPGGPGGSGVDFTLFFGPAAEFFWGPEVRDRFDLVGFDPRGVGRSTALRCFGNLRQSTQAFSPFAFPMTPEEEAIWAAGDALLARQCAQRGSKIGAHMSTANVARDLDRLRAAAGDEQLSYVGLSYGTFIGSTYVNMFPDHVRAVVVDGVLDPVAWANVEGQIPFSTRLRSDAGAQTTLEKFFALCDANPACAFGPDSANRFAALADQLLVGPVPFTDPTTGEEFMLTYQDLIGFTLGSLYDSFSFPFLAEILALIEASASPLAIGQAFNRLVAANGLISKRGFPRYPNFVEAFPAVACEDSNNPTDYAVWSQQGALADATIGYFGRIWTWASSPCAVWPLPDADRYVGPFNHETSNPVLVIGNLYDPATRYEGAVTVHGLLPNSALLTVDVAGHTSLGLSLCAGALTGQYLLDPASADSIDGTLCPPEFDPFDIAPVASAATRTQRDLRHALLPVAAFTPPR
jgi:pimeloyl-ACP methyl ester carboxylesterase